MPKITNAGNNVGYIYNLSYNGYGGDNESGLLKKLTKKFGYKYLFAITANSSQKGPRKTLEKQGFKKHLTFFSSHGDHENLTLWYKINSKYKKIDGNPKSLDIYNCSVSFTRFNKKGKKIGITIQGKNEKVSKFQELGYKRIDKTPIWFKIGKEAVKEKYYKSNKVGFSADIDDWQVRKYSSK